MWQFEYEIQLEDKTETLKFESQAPEREAVWKKADEMGKVKSIHWRIVVDGKLFKEGNFERTIKLPTIEEAMEYLKRTWSKGI